MKSEPVFPTPVEQNSLDHCGTLMAKGFTEIYTYWSKVIKRVHVHPSSPLHGAGEWLIRAAGLCHCCDHWAADIQTVCEWINQTQNELLPESTRWFTFTCFSGSLWVQRTIVQTLFRICQSCSSGRSSVSDSSLWLVEKNKITHEDLTRTLQSLVLVCSFWDEAELDTDLN